MAKLKNRDFHKMLLVAGMSADQIDTVLEGFYAFGGASEIMSLNDYATAIRNYDVLENCVAPDDAHSPVARYLISLGARMADWEDRVPGVVAVALI
ncbi:hypothetical protein E4191_15860 (plasmid) [Paracoccus liaowanqingii]|uniref:Uncharacterized protein n=1 Tax=Paracoccus liaowanqingii TaxID=2560053 RepID=A0A4Y5SQ69_9RHOB|nr:hypothetical protein [Paracoccus liaowanqingii]QDA35650.1 hypothetical protein E4191_15860 [Paracoccus liaowanqingii]